MKTTQTGSTREQLHHENGIHNMYLVCYQVWAFVCKGVSGMKESSRIRICTSYYYWSIPSMIQYKYLVRELCIVVVVSRNKSRH